MQQKNNPYRGESVLWHVHFYYNGNMNLAKEDLEKQYKSLGSLKLAKKWGFSQKAMVRALKSLNIKVGNHYERR